MTAGIIFLLIIGIAAILLFVVMEVWLVVLVIGGIVHVWIRWHRVGKLRQELEAGQTQDREPAETAA